MKRKPVIAMLMLCMALSAAACGEKTDGNAEETQNTDTENAETSEAETDNSEEAEEDTGDGTFTRIVSVDDVSDYVTIGEYKGLTLNRITETITEEDVQSEIDYMLEENGTEVEDGTAESGDTIRISYTGTVDGEILENGSQENYDITIGDNMLGEEFDTGVIGMKKGETREVTVNYSADYYDSEVAGKTVVYTVNLMKITRPGELTDEWVAANTDYNTVDEYRAGVLEQLEQSASDSADSTLYSDAWDQVLETSEVKEYPEEDIEAEKEAYKNLYDSFLEETGMTMEEFLEVQDISEEEFDEECTQYAEQKVMQNLIVQGILDAENLSMGEEDTAELKDFLLQSYGMSSMEEFTAQYGEDEVNDTLALLRVERFIVDQAEVSEMTGSEDNLIANESVYDTDSSSSEESTSSSEESMEIADESSVGTSEESMEIADESSIGTSEESSEEIADE